MSDTNLDRIPKLNGSNYRIWVDQIKSLLMISQLWMIVSGAETCPPKYGTQPTDLTSKEYLEWKRDRRDFVDWQNKALKAAGLLPVCLQS